MSVRLLYVEDDEEVRGLLSMMLLNEGYDVVEASNAEDAIVALQAQHYDLLLTDYNLENKNADWMLRVATGNGSLRGTRVVILTGEVDPAGVGGYRILKKPVDVAVLFAALDDAVAPHVRQAPVTIVQPPVDASQSVVLTLYVTAGSRASKKAERNLERVVQKFDTAQVRLEVRDVTGASLPADALEDDRIVVTPTLVRTHPLPKVWIFGDLSKSDLVAEMIAAGLDDLRARAGRAQSGSPTTG